MFWFISIIISVFIMGTLMFFSYPQKRKRESTYDCWSTYPWVDEGDERVLVPVWLVIIAGVVSIIPVVNLVCSGLIAVIYCIQYDGKSGRDGYELIDRRMVVRAPHLQWFKWLNKKI